MESRNGHFSIANLRNKKTPNVFELGVYIDEALLSVSFCMGEKVGPHSLPFSVTVLFSISDRNGF